MSWWNARDLEVLVTSTARDLVAGSGLSFTDRGRQQLAGVPGEWNILALTPESGRNPPG